MTNIKTAYAIPILALANTLAQLGIPYLLYPLYDGLQMRFPWNDGDLVCHSGSYGHDHQCLESMNCPWDNGDVSCLIIEEAAIYIVEWYEATQKEEKEGE